MSYTKQGVGGARLCTRYNVYSIHVCTQCHSILLCSCRHGPVRELQALTGALVVIREVV